MGNPKDAIGKAKVPMHLIPPALYEPLARVMELGAKKYGAYNWRTDAVNLSVYVSAMGRHWAALMRGEWLDPESKQPHVAHVAANVAIILDAMAEGKLNVDSDMARAGLDPEIDILRANPPVVQAPASADRLKAIRDAYVAGSKESVEEGTRRAIREIEAWKEKPVPGHIPPGTPGYEPAPRSA